MPKVLISINTAWNIANFRAGLVRALIARGYDVVAAAPPDGHERHVEKLGCRYVPLRMDNKGTSPVADLSLLFRYFALMRRENPDVFLSYTVKPNVYGTLAAAANGVPVINNVSGLGTAFIEGGWLAHLVRQLYRISFGFSRTVFFQNEDDLTLFVENRLVDAARTGLLPGSGIDLCRFKPRENDRCGDNAVCFLMMARLLWDKGVAEFVEAARLVKQQVPNARFVLLGFLDVENRTAVPRRDVEAWVRSGAIEYAGTAADVRGQIARSDCVVLPSYREGTPRTLLEGAAMAKPLIATDVPGCRQVVLDGQNGYLCRARDPADLADKMLAFVNLDPAERDRMGRAGRSLAERCFDEEIVVDRYLQAVDEAISARGVGGRPLQPIA